MWLECKDGTSLNTNQVTTFGIEQGHNDVWSVTAALTSHSFGYEHDGCGAPDRVTIFTGTESQCKEQLNKINTLLARHDLERNVYKLNEQLTLIAQRVATLSRQNL